MPKDGATTTWRNAVCPFCGLLCDDLTVTRAQGRVNIEAKGCALAAQGFAAATAPPASPMIGGRAAEHSAASGEAARLLAQSRLPLFAGLGTDIAGMREVLALADRLGGVVDHGGSEALFRNLRVLQDTGWVATTLGEVRDRADLVLIIGPDPSPAFPRFVERFLKPKPAFQGSRRVVHLGPKADGASPLRTLANFGEQACALDDLAPAVSALAALVKGRAIDRPDLAELAAALKASRYAVVTWAAGMLDQPGAVLIVHALGEMVRELNRATRAAVLPLGGGDNAVGANQACLWQAGVPLRLSFARGVPEHDPYRFDARRLLAAREVDLLVWISSFRDSPPPASDVPTILIAPPNAKAAKDAAVFFPVGTPGVDHGGHALRADGLVALNLKATAARDLPSCAAVLSGIAARMKAARKSA
jgi:formylmethanofuran dehydrogenase subunit B